MDKFTNIMKTMDEFLSDKKRRDERWSKAETLEEMRAARKDIDNALDKVHEALKLDQNKTN